MTDTMMAETPDAMMPATPDAMTDTMMSATPDAMMPATPNAMTDTMMAAPAWFSANFTEATSGDSFTIQDFKDKVVLVETMAIWCPTCLQQQNQIKALHEQLGMRDDLVSLSIDVDINETLAGLKDYVAKNGFDWTYSVASTDVARDISNSLWRTVPQSALDADVDHRQARRGTPAAVWPEERGRSAEGAGTIS